jgi:sterol desaturase/sphingolipid hydroxylase (fatty acid hydroxylase superfamily)
MSEKIVMQSRTLGQLVARFVATGEILFYAFLTLLAFAAAVITYRDAWMTFAPVAIVALFYPVLEYLLHRYILHCVAFSRFSVMVPVWYRLHFGHHSDPTDEQIVLAQPVSILMVALSAAALISLGFGDWSSFAAALTASLLAVILYEFVHCLAHSPFLAKQAYLRALQMHHRLHHFHSEKGNYGIAFMIVDRVVGTQYRSNLERPRSPTVNNLGYTGPIARDYPKLAEYAARQRP